MLFRSIQRTAATLTAAGGESVKTLLALQQASEPGPTRLGAAKAILELGIKFREVADLLSARDKIAEQLAAQQANADAQSHLLRLVEARYQAGIVSHLEVLDAQRAAFAAEQGAIQVRRAWLSAATQLYKVFAGDSNEPTDMQQVPNN